METILNLQPFYSILHVSTLNCLKYIFLKFQGVHILNWIVCPPTQSSCFEPGCELLKLSVRWAPLQTRLRVPRLSLSPPPQSNQMSHASYGKTRRPYWLSAPLPPFPGGESLHTSPERIPSLGNSGATNGKPNVLFFIVVGYITYLVGLLNEVLHLRWV